MRQIGWCLDHIQIEMMNTPKEIISEEGKKKAEAVLDKVQKLTDTLIELIHHPKFREHVQRLENAPFEEMTYSPT
ncbi:MAG: hypothetical protein V1729_06960 [Candidatus Woesearchaeota archaeon]